MMIVYKLTQIYPHNAGYPSIPALSASNVLPLENGEVAWLQTWTCVQGNFLPHAIANHLFLFSHTLSQLGFHVRRLPLQPSALHVLMPPEQLLTPLVRPHLGEESDTTSADLVGKLHEVCKYIHGLKHIGDYCCICQPKVHAARCAPQLLLCFWGGHMVWVQRIDIHLVVLFRML